MVGNWQYATPHGLFGLRRRTLNNGTLVCVTGRIEDDLEDYITMCRFGQHCRNCSCIHWDKAGQTNTKLPCIGMQLSRPARLFGYSTSLWRARFPYLTREKSRVALEEADG
jgi:hypothetical protein